MAGVRHFKLRNKNGTEFDMMRKDAFFWEPEGLGWGESVSLVPVGNSYHITDRRINRPEPSGSMVFAGYKQYEEFLQFCQVGGLVLCYMPLTTWRYLEVTISIGKTEIKPDHNRLICDIAFIATSQWYETARGYKSTLSVDEDGKIYAQEYSSQYAYSYFYEDSTSGGVTINNGVLPSYFKLTIKGPTTDPEWRLYVNNKLVKSGKVTANILLGHTLVINCVPNQYSIIEYDANGDVYLDRYGDSDWTTERFFEIPGGDSQMVFTDSTQGVPEAYLEVYRRV